MVEKMHLGDTSKLNALLDQTLERDSSIATEVEMVKEIKDILDELNSILKVFREQIQVGQLFSKGYERVLDQADRQRRSALDANERIKLQTRESRRRHDSEDGEPPENVEQLHDETTSKEIAYRQIAQWQYREPIVAIFENRLSEFAGMENQAQRTYDAVRCYCVSCYALCLILINS